MKRCELCKSMATIYCESDSASLCWSCDAKVHSANFLVARHSRTLLCQLCHSPTPWTASGDKLWPSTGSICRTCVVEAVSVDIVEGVGGENYDADGNEIDNQGPPPAPSSSSTEDCVLLKRKHQNVSDSSSYEEVDSVNINHYSASSTVPDKDYGDETGSFNLSESSSEFGDKKKLRGRNVISGSTCMNLSVLSANQGEPLKFDLNLSAVEY